MQSALAFVVDHWIELALGLVVLLSILNKALPGHPRLATTARVAADLLAFMPMRGAKSAALVWLAGKLGPNLAGAFVDWLSKWLNLPLSPSVPADAKPPLELLPPPRGMVLGRVLFGIIGAIVAGTFAAEGYYGAAAVFAIIFSLCLLLLTGKRSIVLALFAVGARVARHRAQGTHRDRHRLRTARWLDDREGPRPLPRLFAAREEDDRPGAIADPEGAYPHA